MEKQTKVGIYVLVTIVILLLGFIVYLWSAYKSSQKQQILLQSQYEYLDKKIKDDSLLRILELETYKSNEKIIKWKKEIIRDTVYMYLDDNSKIQLFTEFTNKK